MSKRMIIDASHREETRVVVLDGQKVEEFDFEAASKRPLKGNVYLAKVTRVEPSLQAAFVEYGGNRQGFLAFAEIHPDYYQIPIADRMALIAEREAEARGHADEDVESVDVPSGAAQGSAAEAAAANAPDLSDTNDLGGNTEEPASSGIAEPPEADSVLESRGSGESHRDDETPVSKSGPTGEQVAELAGGDESQSVEGEQPAQARLQSVRPSQRWARKRHYKIQEVIKRRQVILVQVVKEERGNKGAALTTYLSLAGRYCVLMPNTPRGGGISRKITSATDRNRLKSAAQSLELPEGMGLIIRTAGENRTKAEIKRDYEYLLRMWDTIRELTLRSNAPACVYEEGDLVKRAIRDLYNKDISEILVEGEEGYRNAKDFMRMLMPSHAKNVKVYKDTVPLFQRYQIESQLDAMFTPTVTLRSGGYIVINQTEALVSIDVNSGRATREHSIEETAHKTNLEAAEEIARQLRLRDLAGLIVIDFIDMEDSRNDRNVEKRLRDSIKNDRARVQIGRISQFGLLEMSRQRLRAGVVAGSTIPCPHCGGQGIVRSIESTALRVMRGLEEEAQRQRSSALAVRAQTEVAIYALNRKRREIAQLETEYDLTIQFESKNDMLAGTFEIERIGQRPVEERPRSGAVQDRIPQPQETSDQPEPEAHVLETGETQQAELPNGMSGSSKRRRRRRRGRDRDRSQTPPLPETQAKPETVHGSELEPEASLAASPTDLSESEPHNAPTPAPDPSNRKKRRRRRGRRSTGDSGGIAGHEHTRAHQGGAAEIQSALPGNPANGSRQTEPQPDVSSYLPNAPSEPVWSLAADAAPRTTREQQASLETVSESASSQNTDTALPENETGAAADEVATMLDDRPSVQAPLAPAKKGWWQRHRS